MLEMATTKRLSECDYRSRSAISASTLRSFAGARSPHHFRSNQEPSRSTPALELGTATHLFVLEEALFKQTVAVLPDTVRRGSGAWTKAAKAHPIVIKEADYQDLLGIRESVRNHKMFDVLFADGAAELSLFWAMTDGTPCKARADWINPKLQVIVDLKTTRDASPFSPKGFRQAILDYRYHWQAAWYEMGAQAVYGDDFEFVFLAVETQKPYACSMMSLTPEDRARAQEEVLAALADYKSCEAECSWPSYGDLIHQLPLPRYRYG